MSVSKEKEEEISRFMEKLGIKEDDLIEKFILGSGRGGQNLQKTSSCVYLKHIPTGLEVKCQKDRSRALNRLFARRLLCEKYQEIILEEKSKKQQANEKIRRQKQTRSRKQKARMLDNKKQHAEKKSLRSRPDEN
ncbi:MAG: peptide chain release factor-like protein [Chlamydiae bacterium]|nr:peptide chain release factor-like protein [Chlamydiota bacterium]